MFLRIKKNILVHCFFKQLSVVLISTLSEINVPLLEGIFFFWLDIRVICSYLLINTLHLFYEGTAVIQIVLECKTNIHENIQT